MTIELSSITFTPGADIVPESGEEDIINSGIANTFAGDDTIAGIAEDGSFFGPGGIPCGIDNTGTFNTAEGNDRITAWGNTYGIRNSSTFNTAGGPAIITAKRGWYGY